MRHAVLLAALTLLAAFPSTEAEDAGALAACPTSAAPAVLTSGVAVLGTDTTAADCHYRISVAGPLDHMRLRANASFAGDHDVYVKHNAPASVGPYFCAGQSFSAAYEECKADLLATGNYHVRVKRWSGSSDFLLTVFVEEIPPTCSLGHGTHSLTGVVVASLTDAEGAFCLFRYHPEAGADFVRFTLSPASADFDMYTRRGAPPTTDVYDCRPYFVGTATETCDHLVESADPWYVMVHRFSGSGSFTLTPASIAIDTIGPGDVVEGEVAEGASRFFKVVAPPRTPWNSITTGVAVVLEGGEADAACARAEGALPGACAPVPGGQADLLVRYAAGLPTPLLHDCAVAARGSTGACFFHDAASATAPPVAGEVAIVDFPGPGRYFIAVHGVDGIAAFRLTAGWL